jgi:hypothetical protein
MCQNRIKERKLHELRKQQVRQAGSLKDDNLFELVASYVPYKNEYLNISKFSRFLRFWGHTRN